MAVPAHDERDYAFAQTYDLPIRYVVQPAGGPAPEGEPFVAHTADEVLVDSGEFTGMPASEAIGAIARAPGGARPGRAGGHLQAARLAGQPAALLGRADPDRVLP